ncbi:hypothetical protein HGP17_10710 [Rhizobium sp. P38BS-XIX]|uniref:hypothetical protein n=1 Tax=Rhizobium sp. P38BS-XIX TaxID=2726740 RepID=UPI0014569988|nr:hypothetical protein [Rhizobium sp. P38BS-XIX]NLR97300.1 hypothetical protein [Rhizobium sp. P38BS-XIX]
MKCALAIRRLFLLVAMLAVVVGPMSLGLASSAMAFSGAMTMEAMASAMPSMHLAEEMPCCPEKHPAKIDCGKGCPVALVCTTSLLAHAPDSRDWSFVISWQTHRYDILPTSQLMSALVDPPARPPKA